MKRATIPSSIRTIAREISRSIMDSFPSEKAPKPKRRKRKRKSRKKNDRENGE